MVSNLMGYDIEVADWNDEMKNLGITVAGTHSLDVVQGNEDRYVLWDGAPKISKDLACSMVEDLLFFSKQADFRLITLNGAGFDFRILAEESGMYDACQELARDHIDLMLIVVALKGFRLGLDAISKGANVGGKLKEVTLNSGEVITDMDGAKAPEMWAKGEYEAVRAYLKEDCRQTTLTGIALEQRGSIGWTSKKGRWNQFNVPVPLPTVQWCIDNPIDRPSWVSDYKHPEEYLEWLKS